MIGSLLSRALILLLGYMYPAYECYKTVELNKPEIKQLRFWCQYWILIAVLAVLERFGDFFISWLPMYAEAKVAFYIYLWYPKTMGSTHVYETFFRPLMAKHEAEIDRRLVELRARVGDLVVLFWQNVASYGQMRFFEIFQYVASQPFAAKTRPVQVTEDEQPKNKKPSSEVIAIKRAMEQPQEATRTPPPSPNTKGQFPEQDPKPKYQGPSSDSNAIKHALQQPQEATRTPPPSPSTKGPLPEPHPIRPSRLSMPGLNPANPGEEPGSPNSENQNSPFKDSINMTRARLRRQGANFSPRKLDA